MESVMFKCPMRVTQGFGAENTAARLLPWYKSHGLGGHEGEDRVPTAPYWGVHSEEGGTVIVDNDDPTGRDYGISVRILSPDGIARLYAHLSENVVFIGEKVRKGQLIGVMGATGNNIAGVHVHYGEQELDASGRALHTDNGYKGWLDPRRKKA